MNLVRAFVGGALLVATLLTASNSPVASGERTPDATTAGAQPTRAHAVTRPGAKPNAIPDIYGPGAVLTAGRVHMKATNFGLLGNPFPNLSADPAAQWPGASHVEYLNYIGLAVGAVNPFATSPDAVRRVSSLMEWRPPTLDPEDRMYVTADGAVNGQRFVNDDGDVDPITGEPRIDEDFLDGRDNDGDGMIDEDFAALGQQEFTCVMRDDTPEAINAVANEPHVPIGLECRQSAWCYSLAGISDFNVIDYQIINRSGHMLDSVYVGFVVDMDAGPNNVSGYWADDRDLPGYPHGDFPVTLALSDPRRQTDHAPVPEVAAGQPLCGQVKFHVNGFSTADADGDGGVTPGIATFLLVDHTVDLTAQAAPSRVGFRAFRSYRAGTPFDQGGAPIFDAQRYALMSSNENVDSDGFVSAAPGSVDGDYAQWCSVGPFRQLPDGGIVHVTIAFAVQNGSYAAGLGYAADYQAYLGHSLGWSAFLSRYPSLETAMNLMATFDGSYELRAGMPVPDWHGRETGVRAPTGQLLFLADCRNADPRLVNDQATSWFDFDCDYCTGPYSHAAGTGYFHHTWEPGSWTADVEGDSPAPTSYAHAIVAPSPSAGFARIRFAMWQPGTVEVTILDVAGRVVRRSPRDRFAAGPVEARWDGRNDAGESMPGGVYLYRIQAGGQDLRGRIVLVR